MPLFEFELTPNIEIAPWGEGDDKNLTWFALSLGKFRINTGKQTLFRYTNEILDHWNLEERDADYQIASFARDVLGSYGAALSPLPKLFEVEAENWENLCDLHRAAVDHDNYYEAFRWLGERSPDTGYLVSCPNVSFYLVGEKVVVGWDNRDRLVDGIPFWEAQFGTIELSIEEFKKESQGFASRLLDQMRTRIQNLDGGVEKAVIETSNADLLAQQSEWEREFSGYLGSPQAPDMPWDEAEEAFERILTDLRKEKFN